MIRSPLLKVLDAGKAFRSPLPLSSEPNVRAALNGKRFELEVCGCGKAQSGIVSFYHCLFLACFMGSLQAGKYWDFANLSPLCSELIVYLRTSWINEGGYPETLNQPEWSQTWLLVYEDAEGRVYKRR
jgi:hypothetical protein